MAIRVSRPWWRGLAGAVVAGILLIAPLGPGPGPELPKPEATTGFRFPTGPSDHGRARDLLANAMRYASPQAGTIDPVSGYPYEGWNHDPDQKLYLRSFTQLTAIGLWIELLANVVAGQADTPYLSRDRALSQLALVAKSLRQDQHDPQLSAKGLLGNFLDLASGRRLGPLAADAEKQMFLDQFGRENGEAIWKALVDKGWIVPHGSGAGAVVKRDCQYGADCFDGPLKPYSDEATKRKVMALLDRRTVLVMFGDNANLSTAIAKALGALLLPAIRDRPEVVAVRRELEQFLDDQREGYADLYDPKAGLFYFGWDCQKRRLFGWEDKQGRWVTGHMDYLVNEFRGPTTFVVMRYGLPLKAVKNLGFKMKPYRTRDGRDVYTLAPWEGSAFQLLGLELSLNEMDNPSWGTLLANAVDVEIDYSSRHNLPGFLSESYTGNGIQYTGDVGIPAIAVTPRPRITDAASLYSLGAAYSIAPAKTEQFLAANWPTIATLLTDHGPWEGFNATRQEAIRVQTTSHTLALALGLLRNTSDHMKRYLDSRGLGDRLADVFRPGDAADLMADDAQVFAWAQKSRPVHWDRGKGGFQVTGAHVGEVSIAFVLGSRNGVNLSGGTLSLRYRSTGPAASVVIGLKPVGGIPEGVIPMEIFTHFADTGGKEEEIQMPLPATPGLTEVKEIVVTYGRGAPERALDLTVTRLVSTPTTLTNRR